MIPLTIQKPLPECFSVASAHDSGRRFVTRFDGSRWSCDCSHYKRFGTDCRHILEKRLETRTKGLFAGDRYEPLVDEVRLGKQFMRIFRLMADGEWRTLSEIAEGTISKEHPYADPESSISAQLRHFRKRRFGSHLVDKRRRGDDVGGLWEYRLVVNEKSRMDVHAGSL